MWETISERVQSGKDISDLAPPKSYKSRGTQLLGAWESWIPTAKEDDIIAAYSHVQRILLTLYKNKETLHLYSVKWRKPVSDRFGKEKKVYRMAVRELGLTREESLARREKYTNMVRNRVYDRMEILTEREVYDVMDKCFNSYDYTYNAIGAMIATGSRVSEIIKISNFSDAGSGNVRIAHLAKGGENKVIIRPILRLRWPHLESLLKACRRDAACVNNPTISINKSMRELFPEHNITTHKCRYIWASLAWQLYGDAPQQEWVRKMFGHDSADTSITYLLYKIQLSGCDPFDSSGRDDIYAEMANSKAAKLPTEEKMRRLDMIAEFLHQKDINLVTAAKYGYSAATLNKWKKEII